MAVMSLMGSIFASRKTSKNCGAKASHCHMLLVATIKPWGLPWRGEECCIESTRAEGKLLVLTKWVHNRLAQWIPGGTSEVHRGAEKPRLLPWLLVDGHLLPACCPVASLPCVPAMSCPSISMSCIFRALPQRCSDLFAVTSASIAHARKELPQGVESNPFDVAILRGAQQGTWHTPETDGTIVGATSQSKVWMQVRMPRDLMVRRV